MMMYFQKCLPESLVNAHNERIVRRGLSVIRSSAADDHDDNSDGGATANTVDQQVGATANQPNQASLLIDPTCVPLDIRPPTDLSPVSYSHLTLPTTLPVSISAASHR